jgi:hypothetical protein
MALKRRDPTVASKAQISRKLQNILDGKLEVISEENMRLWFGRNDSVATEKLKFAWARHWQWKKTTVVAPKLFYVGPFHSPKKGWLVGRKDRQQDLLDVL